MRVVNMLVEGMTEHQFVGQVLKPYLMNFEVFVVPTIVKTKHTHQGTWERGGAPPYYMFKKRLTELLGNQTRTTTMMFDLYGLPDDFPNRDVSPGSAPQSRPWRCRGSRHWHGDHYGAMSTLARVGATDCRWRTVAIWNSHCG